MLKDIVGVRQLPGHRLYLRFEDGVEGEVAFPAPFEGVFAALSDPDFFAAVRLNREFGTIVWPNGAEIDADVLYGLVTGRPVRVGERV